MSLDLRVYQKRITQILRAEKKLDEIRGGDADA